MNVLVMTQSLLEAQEGLTRLEAAQRRGPSGKVSELEWLLALSVALNTVRRHHLICRAGLTLTLPANDPRYFGPRAA